MIIFKKWLNKFIKILPGSFFGAANIYAPIDNNRKIIIG